MIKKLFTKGPTSKFDVMFAVGAAIVAIVNAVDTVKDYNNDKENS